MRVLKILGLAIVTAPLAPAAVSQVFVIGGGLGGKCYEMTLSETTQRDEAIDVCTRALKEDAMTRSNRVGTYVNRGIHHMRLGDHDAALEDYQQALKLLPNTGEAYLNMGAAYVYKKEYLPAISALDKAISLDSSSLHAAFYNRAIAKENSGDVSGAFYDFKKALELNPGWELAELQLRRFQVDTVNG